MAYSKTTWVNGQTPINDTNLNNIENGIAALDTGKQNVLTAGNNITIENDIISATGGSGAGGESLPIGSEIDYNGNVSSIPDGWEISDVDPHTYISNTEKIIGTWDNKPLYRQIITSTLPSTTNTSKTIGTVNDMDKILTFNVTIGYMDRGQYWAYPFPIVTSDINSGIWINANGQIIARWISNATVWADSPIVVVLEYTKTTD